VDPSSAPAMSPPAARRRPPWIVVRVVALVAACVPLAACAISITGPRAAITSGGAISIPVRVVHDGAGGTAILVGVTIGGKGPFTFVLDTGAESSLIDSATAQRLDLKVAGSPHPISGIGGVQQAVPVQLKEWHADVLRLPAVTMDSASFAGDRLGNNIRGLLGSDVLSQFGTITIDYAGGTLTVYKQIAAVGPPVGYTHAA
jgi:predicted aspartyl protease